MIRSCSRFVLLTAALSFSAASVAAEKAILSDGDVSISSEDYRHFLQVMLPADQLSDVVENDRRVRELLADYFVTSVLASEARKQGLDKSADFVAKRRFQEESLLSQMYLDKDVSGVSLPDFSIKAKEEYQANKQKFTRPEMVRAEHILIAINDERSVEQALARAKEVHSLAVKRGADFTALAKEYSDDPSVKQNGGDLGLFPRDRMVKPFSDAAFLLKKGEVSGPVKTAFGYHIIRKLEDQPEALTPYESVKDDLIASLKGKYLADLKRKRIEAIRSSSTIKFDQQVFDEFLKSVR